MAITKPKLPPKYGYVEVINEDGEHVYAPTPKTLEDENRKRALEAQLLNAQQAVYDEMAAAYQEGVEQA